MLPSLRLLQGCVCVMPLLPVTCHMMVSRGLGFGAPSTSPPPYPPHPSCGAHHTLAGWCICWCIARQVLPVQLRALSVLGADATGKPVWGEPNITVRDTTAWCLGKILTHRLSLVDKSHIPSLIKVLCESLRDKPRVAANSVYVRLPRMG